MAIVATGFPDELGLITEISEKRFILTFHEDFSFLGTGVLEAISKTEYLCNLVENFYEYISSKEDIDRKFNPPEELFIQEDMRNDYPLLIHLFQVPILNAVEHGNGYDPGKNVRIEYSLIQKKNHALLEVIVADQGHGFDYGQLIKMARKQSLGTGKGLSDAIRYCQKVSWNKKGNEIRLKVKLEYKTN